MSDISKMTDKQLRNEVQLLRDELAIMKRKYEDIIYNLDTDNFSSRFVKEQGDMKTAIKVTAEGIETKVSNEEFESTKKQTAELISSEVKKLSDADNALSTKITQTEDSISAFAKETENDITTMQSAIDVNKKSINMTVSKFFSNIIDCEDSSEAPAIGSTDVSADTIDNVYHYTYTTATGDVKEWYIYYDSIERVWKKTTGQSIFSSFTQTADGFALKGDFVSTTNAGATVKIKGTRIDIFENNDSDISKMSMGFSESSTNNIPLILLGSGDGSGSTTIDGMTVYNGQGVIQKTETQFIMQYVMGNGSYPGIYMNKIRENTCSINLLADAVYLGGSSGDNQVATHEWVLDNVVARFG
jgi:hypothetical protein